MTEEEAKTKWCPMVVFMLGGGQVRNRDSCYDQSGTHCIGSACMMWRIKITESKFLVDRTMEEIQEIWREDHLLAGYCGLAGEP